MREGACAARPTGSSAAAEESAVFTSSFFFLGVYCGTPMDPVKVSVVMDLRKQLQRFWGFTVFTDVSLRIIALL